MGEETVERLVRIELDAEHTKIEDVSGGVHDTFLVELDGGKEVVVSFCEKEKYLPRFEKEAEVMAFVNRKSNVPVPEVIATDFSQSKIEYPYYITKKVSGNNLESSYSSMSSSKHSKLAYKAGEMLGELHNKVKFDSFGQLKLKNGELKLESTDAWHSAFMDTMRKRLSELENSLFDDVIPEYINEFEKSVEVLQGNFQPVLLHQDFRPANLMGKGTTITAVLD